MKIQSIAIPGLMTGWFLFGCSVALISLVRLNTLHVWGENPGFSYPHRIEPQLTSMQLALPQEWRDPDEWGYHMQVVAEWLWLRMAENDFEKSRRLLWIAQARLNSSSQEYMEGDRVKAAQLMAKSEQYFLQSIQLADHCVALQSSTWRGELDWTFKAYASVLATIFTDTQPISQQLPEMVSIQETLQRVARENGYLFE